jgi:hypothetical protein
MGDEGGGGGSRRHSGKHVGGRKGKPSDRSRDPSKFSWEIYRWRGGGGGKLLRKKRMEVPEEKRAPEMKSGATTKGLRAPLVASSLSVKSSPSAMTGRENTTVIASLPTKAGGGG